MIATSYAAGLKEFLRESEAQNRALLEGAVDGIITLDERGIIHAFNPAAERIFGYTAEQVIGHNVEMLMPLPYNENHDEYLGHYLRTNETRIIGTIREVEGKRQDGTTLPLELSVSEIVAGQERMFLGILHDISESKRAQEMVRKQQTELAHIMRLSTLSKMASGQFGLLRSASLDTRRNRSSGTTSRC